jgi:hypothetical protein
MRAFVSAAISEMRAAIASACARDSITHGPAKKSGGCPPPMR